MFLTEQKDDLEQAERELRGIIEKLTEQMKEIFAASFAQLNRYFGETFQEIFGGGSAELALEDENDILGCGIEIRVTPPGKKHSKTCRCCQAAKRRLLQLRCTLPF